MARLKQTAYHSTKPKRLSDLKKYFCLKNLEHVVEGEEAEDEVEEEVKGFEVGAEDEVEEEVKGFEVGVEDEVQEEVKGLGVGVEDEVQEEMKGLEAVESQEKDNDIDM